MIVWKANMDDILVSIITVCYNSESTISRTIESVMHQTYRNIQYIIIDGKSTDHTMDIVNSYKDEFGDRIKIVSEKDDGIYYAMNKGICLSDGTLVGLINSDDYYENDAVEKVVNKYKENHSNPLSVYYGADRAWRDGKIYAISFHSAEFLQNSMISHPATFITKEAYKIFGMYDTKYKCVADYDLLLKYKESGKIDFVPIYEILANFTCGGACSSESAQLELLDLQVGHGIRTKRSVLLEKFFIKKAMCMKKRRN